MLDTQTVQEKSTAKIWVFIVDSDHGTNVTTHVTREAAESANFNYCDEWWHHEYADVPRPPDDQLVAEYWRRQNEGGSEWHLITECDLSGVKLTPTDGSPELPVVGDGASTALVPVSNPLPAEPRKDILLTYSEQVKLTKLMAAPGQDHDTFEGRLLVNAGYAERFPDAGSGVTMLRITEAGRRRLQLIQAVA